MHDLQQEMGLKIVRQGIEDPGKRSRLRDIEEVSDVLENKKGSDAVEGIKLDLSEFDEFHLNADSFNMMTNLRFLILYIPLGKKSGNVEYPRVFNKFPAKLRYLEWHGYRLKSLPPTFNAKMVVEIRMPHSHIVELWWGVKDVPNLEGIDLTECKQLKNLPDLSKATKLRWVNLSGCEKSQHSATITELETSDENRGNEVNNRERGAWLKHPFYLGLGLGTFLFAAVVVAKSTRGR
ncbi:hypothetical protein RIF29_21524 [Crotalaria pallida]|uniref:Uncharacterized protein n=1 Tax=Crotalaria pallida TaxID=3830 RepID=A0AAN9F7L2_CROPI